MDIKQEYEEVEVGRLREHPQNPRIGDVDVIDESIEENGWYGVCTVQRSTGFILAGNHRYRAAVKRGAAKVPVVWKDVDDQAALKILLADNKTADGGSYDEAMLADVLSGLETLDGTGYGLGALEKLQSLEEAAEEASDAEDEGAADGAVPDDVYTPDWAVLVVCTSEDDQAAIYERLREELGEERKLRVVAV